MAWQQRATGCLDVFGCVWIAACFAEVVFFYDGELSPSMADYSSAAWLKAALLHGNRGNDIKTQYFDIFWMAA